MRRVLVLVVLLVSGGLAMLSIGEADEGQFRPVGFLLTLLSCAIGGLRWALSQVRTREDSVEMQKYRL